MKPTINIKDTFRWTKVSYYAWLYFNGEPMLVRIPRKRAITLAQKLVEHHPDWAVAHATGKTAGITPECIHTYAHYSLHLPVAWGCRTIFSISSPGNYATVTFCSDRKTPEVQPTLGYELASMGPRPTPRSRLEAEATFKASCEERRKNQK